MSIGNFRETSEKNETNETTEKTDNAEKYKNQILKTPESYDDDFDKKLDSLDNKRKLEDGKERNANQSENTGKDGAWERLRNFFSKREKGENTERHESKASTEQPSDNKSFRDRLNVDNSDNHIEKQAVENLKKKAESPVESDANTDENESDITVNEGRSRAEEAYNRHYNIKDDER